MPSVEEICLLFYESEFLPLFVCRNETFSAQFPETTLPVQPPAYLLRALRQQPNAAALQYSDANCLYFLVRAEDGVEVFGGPVPAIWADRETLDALHREYLVLPSDESAFDDYMERIPPYNISTLGTKVALLRLLLTGVLQPTVMSDAILSKAENPQFRPESAKTARLFNSRANEAYNNSFEIEAQLQRFVTEGDLEGFDAFTRNLPPFHAGDVANSGLRTLKNNLIVSAALVCRSSIAAGIPRETAYALSDAYIQEMERLQRSDDLLALSASMFRDFILRVRSRKEALISANTVHSRLMHRCVNFIHRNLNRRITVKELAEHVNLSRSYLSTTFRQSMGVSLNRYILDAKLEEAASLLQYTDRPIADIAEYLCFSSQSHFQQAFKEKYGQTPRSFRLKALQ